MHVLWQCHRTGQKLIPAIAKRLQLWIRCGHKVREPNARWQLQPDAVRSNIQVRGSKPVNRRHVRQQGAGKIESNGCRQFRGVASDKLMQTSELPASLEHFPVVDA